MPVLLKRDRLIEAAKALFAQQGVARTTLAEIALVAEVPLGNVYYHFRTKESLVEAVIQAHIQDVQTMLAQCDLLPDPRERLLALLAVEREAEPMVMGSGCPHGSLSQELTKEESALAIASEVSCRCIWTGSRRSIGSSARRGKRPTGLLSI